MALPPRKGAGGGPQPGAVDQGMMDEMATMLAMGGEDPMQGQQGAPAGAGASIGAGGAPMEPDGDEMAGMEPPGPEEGVELPPELADLDAQLRQVGFYICPLGGAQGAGAQPDPGDHEYR